VLIEAGTVPPPSDLYVLPSAEFLSLPAEARPTPCIVWGRLDLIADCLAQGALDALTLPLDPAELVARIIGRRESLKPPLPQGLMTQLDLGARERQALVILSRAGAGGLSRTALSWALWGRELPSSRRLDVLISGLRKKLEDWKGGESLTIKAERGLGYALHEKPVDKLWQSRE